MLNVKEGDFIAYFHSDTGWYAKKVERVTKTTIIVAGLKFNRETGRQIGVTWSRAHIAPIEDHVEDIKRDREERERLHIANKLSKLQWAQLSRETLDAVLELIKE